jgi:hypothetical protein
MLVELSVTEAVSRRHGSPGRFPGRRSRDPLSGLATIGAFLGEALSRQRTGRARCPVPPAPAQPRQGDGQVDTLICELRRAIPAGPQPLVHEVEETGDHANAVTVHGLPSTDPGRAVGTRDRQTETVRLPTLGRVGADATVADGRRRQRVPGRRFEATTMTALDPTDRALLRSMPYPFDHQGGRLPPQRTPWQPTTRATAGRSVRVERIVSSSGGVMITRQRVHSAASTPASWSPLPSPSSTPRP